MLALIVKGGWVMAPIIALSVVALAIVLERLWLLWSIRLDVKALVREVVLLLQAGREADARARCDGARHPIGRLLALGIANRGLERGELERMLEREGEEHVRRLERRLPGLLVIIGVEPMLGFLGTIIGLIKAFMDWEALGANITVSALAAGIYQAMITTAGGLIVAIPYYLCYHLLVARIQWHANAMSAAGDELLGVLTGQTREVPV
jgi:biopolymer transport protein ExbB